MPVLSIQSHVTYGHVGNSAAVFPLQRAGVEVWPVHTVNFSNHTEYPEWGGPVFSADTIADVLSGLRSRGALSQATALLTGYLGTPELAHVVTKTRAELAPDSIYVCDPVIGNAVVGDFVSEDIVQAFRHTVIPAADSVTPNQYEVARLTGRLPKSTPRAPRITLAETLAGAQELQALGPSTVLVTSLHRPADDPDLPPAPNTIEMLALSQDAAYLVATPKVEHPHGGKFVGAGDVAAALWCAQLLNLRSQPYTYQQALEHVAAALFEVISATAEHGSTELELIKAQDAFVRPGHAFSAVQTQL